MYELTSMASIRGRVNVVRAAELTKILQNIFPYKKKSIEIVGDTENRETDLFYVNRFQSEVDTNFHTNSGTRASVNAIRNGEESLSVN